MCPGIRCTLGRAGSRALVSLANMADLQRCNVRRDKLTSSCSLSRHDTALPPLQYHMQWC